MQCINIKPGNAGCTQGKQAAPQKIRSLRGITAIAVLFLATLAYGQELPDVPELDTILAEQRFALEQECLPEFQRDGEVEYINCVRTKLANQRTDSALLLDRYSFDDKYALQQSCSEYYGRNEVYTECLKSEISKLDSITEPRLSSLNEDERSAIQQNCFDDQKNRGAPAYRSCLNQALERMLQIERVDLSGFSAVEVNEMKLSCINSGRKLRNANYRLCLAEALATKLKQQRSTQKPAVTAVLPTEAVPQSATADTDTDTSNPSAETTPVPIADAVNVTQINNERVEQPTTDTEGNSDADPQELITNDQESVGSIASPTAATKVNPPVVTATTMPDSHSTAIDNTTSTINAATVDTATGEDATVDAAVAQEQAGPGIGQFFANLRDDPLGTLQSGEIKNYTKYLIFLLPILILLIFLQILRVFLRKRREDTYTARVSEEKQLRTDLYNDPAFGASRGSSESKQARSVAMHDHRLDFLSDEDDLQPADLDPIEQPAEDDTYRDTYRAAPVEKQTSDQAPVSTSTSADFGFTQPVYEPSEFSQWIGSKPVPEIKRLCTEFMLYWISYGEGNYNDQLKNQLLHSQDLDEHDQIKKWVFERNPSAFVDLHKQLKEIFSVEEMRQTIMLMMAVLIKREISPVQNTFLRFLADFTNIGGEWLAQEYRTSFGKNLPPLPRPDDERWWQSATASGQSMEESESEGEGEGESEDKDRLACLKQLGLQASASGEDIASAYHRIALRCHPDRFDQLGEKERNLALRYFERCSDAHNFLLELET